MKKEPCLIITLLLAFGFFDALSADSPVTSTNFSDAYLDIPVVAMAKKEGIMSMEIARYLAGRENPVDVKAAVVNALSWKFEGKNNAKLFLDCLAKIHQKKKAPEADDLSADELFCHGYLTVMDDYFHPEKAIPLLEAARERNRLSFTVAMVLALTKAQKAMGSDWCGAWRLVEGVLKDGQLKQDLRPAGKKIILDYMGGYRESCK